MTKLKLKIYLQFAYLILHSLFYRVKYIVHEENQHETGYYLVPRWYVFLWFLPLYVACSLIVHVFEASKTFINSSFSYDQSWVQSEKRKLTFKERIGLRYQLLN